MVSHRIVKKQIIPNLCFDCSRLSVVFSNTPFGQISIDEYSWRCSAALMFPVKQLSCKRYLEF